MINTKTTRFYNDVISLLNQSEIPPINAQLVLEKVIHMVEEEVSRAIQEENKRTEEPTELSAEEVIE